MATTTEHTYRIVPIATLRSGTALKAPIYDDNHKLLLAAGLTLTDALLEQVARRGIQSVLVERRDLARAYSLEPQGVAEKAPPDRRGVPLPPETRESRLLDAELEAMDDKTPGPQGEAFSQRIQPHDAAPYDEDERNRFVEEHEESLGAIVQLSRELSRRDQPDLEILGAVSAGALERIADDRDLFVCLGINPFYADYPGRHSMHAAALAMAMGARIGLDEATLVDLAIGCLVHDFGMIRLDPMAYQTDRRLDDLEFLEITRHPILTFEMLASGSQHLSARSRMVAYQVHERSDGSGYPRGRTAAEIHDLAKLAAVADTFVALVAPRPHRRGMLPYFAMEKILHGVKAGLYDPRAARALLETVCLFPIGSYVELNDNRVGKVLRSNGPHYDRPVVHAWNRESPKKNPVTVDLVKEADYRVTKPLGRIG